MEKIKLVCIIDDDPIFIFGIKKIMKSVDFCEEFLICKNGHEALEKLNAHIENGLYSPEVILVDLDMPVMDGWQFLSEYTKNEASKKSHIYIVSSSINKNDENRAKSVSQVVDYVLKPLSKDDLAKMLHDFDA